MILKHVLQQHENHTFHLRGISIMEWFFSLTTIGLMLLIPAVIIFWFIFKKKSASSHDPRDIGHH